MPHPPHPHNLPPNKQNTNARPVSRVHFPQTSYLSSMNYHTASQRLFYIAALLLLLAKAYSQPQPCSDPAAMTSSCLTACIICDIDGFTGTNDLAVQGQTFPGFCTTMFHNMSYIAFIAGSEDLTVEVDVSNCTINWGVEIGFFESPDCETFIPVTDCNTNVLPNTTVAFSNDVPLTVGQHYYLIMDGSNGDICDWTFNVVEGTTLVSPLTSTGTISGNDTTCPDFPTTFTTEDTDGATIFYWTINGVPHNDINQTTDIVFPADGTYEICVTAANACDQATPTCTTIEVITPGTLFIDETLCDNDCLEVAGETLCDPGDYEFHITLANGCDSAIFVTLDILPQAQSFIDINLCSIDTFFIGTTPYNQTGIYMDTILTAMECDSIVNLDLFVIECEIIAATDFIQPVCTGESNGFLIFSVENGTPPFSYTWEHLTDPGIGGNGTTTLFDNNTIPNVPAGDYEINIMDDFGNDVVVFQSVTDPPVLTLSLQALDRSGVNVSCADGADGMITAYPSGGIPGYSYLWSNGTTGQENTDLPAGWHDVSVTDSHGCEITDSLLLTAPPPIIPFVSFVDPNCDGDSTGLIRVDSVVGGVFPYEFALDNDTFSTWPVYRNLWPTTYTISIRDANGCLKDTSDLLDIPDIPELDLGDDLWVSLGCPIDIPTQINNTTLTNIQWTPNRWMDCDSCLRPQVTPLDVTTYTLMVTSAQGCTDEKAITIHVEKPRDVFFPNAFSPNGDGVNDFFFIGSGKTVAQINYLKIFDRWGEQVFEAYDMTPDIPEEGWDGRLDNEPLASGVFVWIAEVRYIDGFVLQFSGDVSIVK